MAIDQGGGGGRAGSDTNDDIYALDMPYDISGEPTADKMQQLNEMLTDLFRRSTRVAGDVTTINNSTSSGGGDVSGPAGAVADNIAVFDGVTGKIIKDGGSTIAAAIASAVASAVAATGVISLTISVPQATLELANTTPITLVAAQGAKTVIMPVAWWPELDLTTAYANNPTWSLAYAVAPTLNILDTFTMATNGAAPATRLQVGQNNNPTDRQFTYGTTDPRNSALVFRLNGDLTGGGAATAKIHFVYRVGGTF